MVRLALQSAQKKGAIVSLMVAGIAAASVWAGYWVWHQDQGTLAAQRGLTDVIVRWRCSQNHDFEATGSYEAVPCPTCKQPARILIAYQCPKDGVFEARIMYNSAARKLSAIQLESGPWIEVNHVIPCPRCGGELRPKERGPFDRSETPATGHARASSQPMP